VLVRMRAIKVCIVLMVLRCFELFDALEGNL
jgi:hypothetical protein